MSRVAKAGPGGKAFPCFNGWALIAALCLCPVGCRRDHKPTATKPAGPLPRGFVAVEGTATDLTGWPMEIRCLKDDSVMVLVPAGQTQIGLNDSQIERLAQIEAPWTRPEAPTAVTQEEKLLPGKLLTPDDISAAKMAKGSVPLAVAILGLLQERGAEVPASDLEDWRKQGRKAESLLASPTVQDGLSNAIVEAMKKGAIDDHYLALIKTHPGSALNEEDLRAFEKGGATQQAGIFLLWCLQPTEEPKLAPDDLKKWRKDGRAAQALLKTPALRTALVAQAERLVGRTPEAELREMFPVARKVDLGAFYVDKHEITNLQYRRFFKQIDEPSRKPGLWYGGGSNLLAPNKRFYDLWSDFKRNGDHQPVTCVGETDAREYARWAGKSLPTRDEWERAARGDGQRLFTWGNGFKVGDCSCNIGPPPRVATQATRPAWRETIQDLWRLKQAWRELREGIPPAKVGQFPNDVSPYGCYDMAGNVSEWVVDPDRGAEGALTTMGGNAESFWPQYVTPAAKSYTSAGTLLGFRTILRMDASPKGP